MTMTSNKPLPDENNEEYTTELITEIKSRQEFYDNKYDRHSEVDLMFRAADALAKFKQEMAELSMKRDATFRINNELIVTNNQLRIKLAEQAAIIEAAKQWNRDSDGDGNRDPSKVRRSELTAILYGLTTEQ